MSIGVAIIGGSGIYDPHLLEDIRSEKVNTPFGSVMVRVGKYRGQEVAFQARHGEEHVIPPHRINYRANIWGLKCLGVKNILATAAVGSLNASMKPKQFIFIDQFLDFTKSRPQTFVESGVVHLDMTEPYCPELRKLLVDTARDIGLDCHLRGTYVCSEGPRFETPAEIRMFRHFGGDVIGMTGVPEVVLAREAGICYATIAMVTNFAAGISVRRLSHQEVLDVMGENLDKIRRLILSTLAHLKPERECLCQEMLFDPAIINGSQEERNSR